MHLHSLVSKKLLFSPASHPFQIIQINFLLLVLLCTVLNEGDAREEMWNYELRRYVFWDKPDFVWAPLVWKVFVSIYSIVMYQI